MSRYEFLSGLGGATVGFFIWAGWLIAWLLAGTGHPYEHRLRVLAIVAWITLAVIAAASGWTLGTDAAAHKHGDTEKERGKSQDEEKS